MDESEMELRLMEVKLKIIELAYKYDKPIPDVITDMARIRMEPAKPEAPVKKTKKGKKGKAS
ncbi:MAG: hypothetical protein J7L23_04865 [Candidatus Diapherotrites archaeon]|nr:hypothetical protein [Candidatus Diapherotrites archaeon]